MYGKNVTTFLLNMVKEGKLELDTGDEVVEESMVARNGEITNPRVREAFGMAPAAAGTPS